MYLLKFNPLRAENVLLVLNLSGKPLFLNKNPLLVSKPCPPPGKGGTGKDEFLHGRQLDRKSVV